MLQIPSVPLEVKKKIDSGHSTHVALNQPRFNSHLICSIKRLDGNSDHVFGGFSEERSHDKTLLFSVPGEKSIIYQHLCYLQSVQRLSVECVQHICCFRCSLNFMFCLLSCCYYLWALSATSVPGSFFVSRCVVITSSAIRSSPFFGIKTPPPSFAFWPPAKKTLSCLWGKPQRNAVCRGKNKLLLSDEWNFTPCGE